MSLYFGNPNMVRKLLGGLLIYALFVYSLVMFGPAHDFYPIHLDPPESLQNIPFLLILGGIFRVLYDVLRGLLKFVTIPLNFVTFGGLHLALNIGILYLVPSFVEKTQMGTVVTMGSFLEVAIMAFLLSLIGFLLKHV